ncbi:MAG: RNA-directed DNA polymerase, partial [Moorea sp. SIO2C4]|nr:RNA-directed DNA polymerase [Moorena sp. SIO2C4]
MSDQPRTRQELYDRIRQIGKEEFVLEEMIRYGFWPAQGEMPEDPADEIRR